ncbi:vanadium-dependent haloperoxidase [uncultured Cyclobacterium sp.]|uniref:vanadium-dependent haloperoxidase n=1 Tax=uncultured Cyclobacterium sp. TaxID=453820 RepID=UPI0030EC85E6
MSKGKNPYILTFLFLVLTTPLFAQISTTEKDFFARDKMIEHLFSITDVMVTDVTSPPGAARFYGYSLLAAYLVYHDTENLNNATLIKHLQSPIANLEPTLKLEKENINLAFASTYAMLEVGKNIMPSGKKLTSAQETLISQYSKEKLIKKKEIKRSIIYAENIATVVLNYAKEDGYLQLSTLKRYSPTKGQGKWYPTPPAYLAAIDPDWRTIRPFFLENLPSFSPPAPAEYSEDKNSSFFTQLTEVYEVTTQLTEEQKLIANFWDCNPFNVSYSGHMAIGLKKISPGGHWMGITGIASQKAGLGFEESLYIHTLVAMGLHDAFISCWDEKYRSDRIRPLTAINQLIDDTWRPILQTPPFPEYTSGHSVISKTSAVLLTSYFGENFKFIDTSEVFFGLPERAFDSFLEASSEAAISRLYGGIHFRDAIEVGMQQGEKIANYILERTNTHQNHLIGTSSKTVK